MLFFVQNKSRAIGTVVGDFMQPGRPVRVALAYGPRRRVHLAQENTTCGPSFAAPTLNVEPRAALNRASDWAGKHSSRESRRLRLTRRHNDSRARCEPRVR